MPIGERVVTRYVLHPPAASGWLPDGAPLDAGSAHLVHSNLSHLSERNVRLLAHTTGPGPVTASTSTAAWTDIIDAAPDAAADAWGVIPWQRPDNAFLCGPVARAHTRLGTAPAGFYPRKVRVVVQGWKADSFNTELTVVAALTSTADTPLRSQVYARAQHQVLDTAVTTPGGDPFLFDLNLNCTLPLRPTQTWRCREDGDAEGAAVSLVPGWVWVGWYSSTSPVHPDRVESVSVFEVW